MRHRLSNTIAKEEDADSLPAFLAFSHRSGFTIVELLIVVVVIAILAAITILAYNGIQNRARVAALQASLNQQGQKLAAWKLDHSEQYPSDLATAQSNGLLVDTTDTDYAIYTASPDLSNYCATAVNGETKYSISSTNGSPVAGECVTNLAPNPSFETSTSGVGAWAGAGIERPANAQAVAGSSVLKVTMDGSTAGQGFSTGYSVGFGTYTASMYLWGTGTLRMFSRFQFTDGTALPDTPGANTPLLSSSPQRRIETSTYPVTAGKTPSQLAWMVRTLPAASAGTFYADALMLTAGSTVYSYGDGDTRGWFWNGPANNSTSTGPAIAQ